MNCPSPLDQPLLTVAVIRPADTSCAAVNNADGGRLKESRVVANENGCSGHNTRLEVAGHFSQTLNTTNERHNMKVLLINNDGGGFADYVEVAEETTVAQLFERQIGSNRPGDYLIRVNRQPCPADQVLHEGDRISITPTKIEGATS